MWFNTPIIRLALPFFCGYYFSVYAEYSCSFEFLASLPVAYIAMLKYNSLWKYSRRHWSGIILWAMFFFLGTSILPVPPHFSTNLPCFYEIESMDKHSASHIRYKAKALNTLEEEVHTWLYISAEEARLLYPGNVLASKSSPKSINPPQEAGSFDFKGYSQSQGITHSAFLLPGEYHLYSDTNKTTFLERLRKHLASKLESSFENPRHVGIIQALVLGIKSNLEDQDRENFGRAGAMHVLAVSGLHVGLIYGVINFICSLIFRHPKFHLARSALALASIWMYAGITAFSPSVLRATIMLSFIIVGTLLGRRLNSLNSVAASAFLLVLIDPFVGLSLGFQLSYLAVCGILLLHEPLSKLYRGKAKLIKWAWDLTCVSLAAQLFTMPVALYHFGILPAYSLLTNLAVIPLATVLLYSGLALTIMADIPVVGYVLQRLCSLICWALTLTTEGASTLPGAVINLHNISAIDGAFMLLCALTFAVWLRNKWPKALIVMLILMLAGTGLALYSKEIKNPNYRFVVHATSGGRSFSIISRDQGIQLSDLKVLSQRDSMLIANCWQHYGLSLDTVSENLDSNEDYWITIAEDVHIGNIPIDNEGTDIGKGIMIPRNRRPTKHEELMDGWAIVIPKSMKYYNRQEWLNYAKESQIEIWDIRDKGSYEIIKTD